MATIIIKVNGLESVMINSIIRNLNSIVNVIIGYHNHKLLDCVMEDPILGMHFNPGKERLFSFDDVLAKTKKQKAEEHGCAAEISDWELRMQALVDVSKVHVACAPILFALVEASLWVNQADPDIPTEEQLEKDKISYSMLSISVLLGIAATCNVGIWLLKLITLTKSMRGIYKWKGDCITNLIVRPNEYAETCQRLRLLPAYSETEQIHADTHTLEFPVVDHKEELFSSATGNAILRLRVNLESTKQRSKHIPSTHWAQRASHINMRKESAVLVISLAIRNIFDYAQSQSQEKLHTQIQRDMECFNQNAPLQSAFISTLKDFKEKQSNKSKLIAVNNALFAGRNESYLSLIATNEQIYPETLAQTSVEHMVGRNTYVSGRRAALFPSIMMLAKTLPREPRFVYSLKMQLAAFIARKCDDSLLSDCLLNIVCKYKQEMVALEKSKQECIKNRYAKCEQEMDEIYTTTRPNEIFTELTSMLREYDDDKIKICVIMGRLQDFIIDPDNISVPQTNCGQPFGAIDSADGFNIALLPHTITSYEQQCPRDYYHSSLETIVLDHELHTPDDIKGLICRVKLCADSELLNFRREFQKTIAARMDNDNPMDKDVYADTLVKSIKTHQDRNRCVCFTELYEHNSKDYIDYLYSYQAPAYKRPICDENDFGNMNFRTIQCSLRTIAATERVHVESVIIQLIESLLEKFGKEACLLDKHIVDSLVAAIEERADGAESTPVIRMATGEKGIAKHPNLLRILHDLSTVNEQVLHDFGVIPSQQEMDGFSKLTSMRIHRRIFHRIQNFFTGNNYGIPSTSCATYFRAVVMALVDIPNMARDACAVLQSKRLAVSQARFSLMRLLAISWWYVPLQCMSSVLSSTMLRALNNAINIPDISSANITKGRSPFFVAEYGIFASFSTLMEIYEIKKEIVKQMRDYVAAYQSASDNQRHHLMKTLYALSQGHGLFKPMTETVHKKLLSELIQSDTIEEEALRTHDLDTKSVTMRPVKVIASEMMMPLLIIKKLTRRLFEIENTFICMSTETPFTQEQEILVERIIGSSLVSRSFFAKMFPEAYGIDPIQKTACATLSKMGQLLDTLYSAKRAIISTLYPAEKLTSNFKKAEVLTQTLLLSRKREEKLKEVGGLIVERNYALAQTLQNLKLAVAERYLTTLIELKNKTVDHIIQSISHQIALDPDATHRDSERRQFINMVLTEAKDSTLSGLRHPITMDTQHQSIFNKFIEAVTITKTCSVGVATAFLVRIIECAIEISGSNPIYKDYSMTKFLIPMSLLAIHEYNQATNLCESLNILQNLVSQKQKVLDYKKHPTMKLAKELMISKDLRVIFARNSIIGKECSKFAKQHREFSLLEAEREILGYFACNIMETDRHLSIQNRMLQTRPIALANDRNAISTMARKQQEKHKNLAMGTELFSTAPDILEFQQEDLTISLIPCSDPATHISKHREIQTSIPVFNENGEKTQEKRQPMLTILESNGSFERDCRSLNSHDVIDEHEARIDEYDYSAAREHTVDSHEDLERTTDYVGHAATNPNLELTHYVQKKDGKETEVLHLKPSKEKRCHVTPAAISKPSFALKVQHSDQELFLEIAVDDFGCLPSSELCEMPEVLTFEVPISR